MDRSSNTGVIEMAAPHEGKEKGKVAWKGNLVVIYFGECQDFHKAELSCKGEAGANFH